MVILHLQQEVVLDTFKARLLTACNACEEIPEYGKGQQTEIATKLNVSQEAVRKWFAGETVPRSKLSFDLAKLLKVKHSWLMLGTGHGEIETDIKLAQRHKASVYGLMSYITGVGLGATFSEGGAVEDIMMIENGKVVKVCTESASESIDGVYEVTFTEAQVKGGVTVAFVAVFKKQGSAFFDLLKIDPEVWEKKATKAGRNYTLKFSKSTRGNVYSADRVKLSKFLEGC